MQRAFSWDGRELKPTFEVDFTKERLGRAHHMKFSAKGGGKSLAEAYPAMPKPVVHRP